MATRILPESLQAEQATLVPSPNCPEIAVTRDGQVYNIGGKIALRSGPFRLKPQVHNNGYLAFEVRDNKRRRRYYVHQLVAGAFHGPKPFLGACVRHLDGNPLNNCAVNLAWGTMKENAADRGLHGRNLVGERNTQAKLTRALVQQIRDGRAQGESHKQLADRFGVSKGNIGFILRGETWR